MESLTRNTAYKIWISDLISGNYVKGEAQFDSGYVNIKGKNVSRVNLICSVVDKFSGENYSALTLDDGSGIVPLKAWNENVNLFLDLDVGDLVLVVGKVKQYNNSIYITPEVVKKIDNPLWLKLRKIELVKEYGESARVEISNFKNKVEVERVVVENVVEGSREKVLRLIESLDSGEGAELAEVVEKSGLNEANTVIQELVQDGEIFELHKGKYRLMG